MIFTAKMLSTGWSKTNLFNLLFPYDIILIFNRKIKYIDICHLYAFVLQTVLQKGQSTLGIHKFYANLLELVTIYTLCYNINNIVLFYPLGRICA